VSIIGPNCPQWILSHAGAASCGALANGIYTTNRYDSSVCNNYISFIQVNAIPAFSSEVVSYICKQSNSSVLVVEDMKELKRLLDEKPASINLPTVRHFILMNGIPEEQNYENVLSWEKFMEVGKEFSRDSLQKAFADLAVNKACCLLYTSGTTGLPKGKTH